MSHPRSALLLKRQRFAPLSIIIVNIDNLLLHLFKCSLSLEPPSLLLLSTERWKHGKIYCDEGTLKEEGRKDTVDGWTGFRQSTLLDLAVAASIHDESLPRTGTGRQKSVQ